MWHTDEIVKIIQKIAEEYGYDVFKHRKQVVGLCGDLLAGYETEKNIFQMLFQAGLGENLNSVPYNSEQELRKGLLLAKKFLHQQAIAENVQENVLEIIIKSFSAEEIQGLDIVSLPKTVKNYNDVHFKLTIPIVHEFTDRLEFVSKFMYKDMGADVDSVLEKCVLTDRVNVIHESHMDYTLLKHKESGAIKISIPKDKKKIFLHDSYVDFLFLCSNNRKIDICYQIGLDVKLQFRQIKIYMMTDAEQEKMHKLFEAPQDIGAEDPGGKGNEEKGGSVGESPTYMTAGIKDYSDALHREIHYLKLGKGKKYKIVSGVKINRDDKGIYTYSFELETELHLPDDAPVVVDTSNGLHAVGTVLTCEDFQTILLLDRDLGEHVLTAYLTVEPWKLLEALDKKINSLNPNYHHLAILLLEKGPKVSTTEDISKVPKGAHEVTKKLQRDNIVAIWGPPGTGKTYTMAQIARNYIQNGKSVLIVSHSNVSVDGVVKKVVDLLGKNMNACLENGKVLRFGFVRDEELSRHPYATSFNYALNRCPGFSEELAELMSEKNELKAKKQEKTPEYDLVEKKIKNVRSEIRKEERKYVEKAQLIGTTISKATIDPLFEQRQFDLVMFDEVSMAYVPQIIAAASMAKEKFLCVGDFRQLAPISQCPDAKLLQTDIFSYLRIIDNKGNMYYHPWLVMLNEQRRMHPAISGFSNKYVYKKLLKDHVSVIHGRDKIVASKPLPEDALHLINLVGTYCAADKNSDGSRFNILSAIVSFSTAISVDRTSVKSVGIITPYAAQTRLIRAMVRDYYGQEKAQVSCATVHQFQGSEADVLVFDAVESYPKSAVGFLMGKDPDNITRLINVAVTRARGKLITVANERFWDNLFKGTDHIFYRLLSYIKNGHHVVSQSDKTLKPYMESINVGRVFWIYTDETDALAILRKDIKRAKGKIVASLPGGELRETHTQIISEIENADSRGIDIYTKSNEYSELPDAWKKYCRGTENATFPLIVIDDEIAWYGMPTAKWKFTVDKTTSLMTVVHVMVRIKGTNTIEMIKALTELETIQVGMNKRSLLNAGGRSEIGSKTDKIDKVSGLSAFVEEKEFCPKCKSHMVLTKNQKGTAYLRCSNKECREMKYLTPELMNWYITSRNISCPKQDGGELKGILGKFGPCVRCDRGHFLKPEEI